MRKKFNATFIIIAILLSLIPFGLLISVTAKKTSLPDYQPIDIGTEIRSQNLKLDESMNPLYTPSSSSPKSSSSESSPPEDYHGIGDVVTWLSYDIFQPSWYLYRPTNYELVAYGDWVEIWVQVWDERQFPDPSDTRSVEITEDQIDYLLDEFDYNIYPTVTGYFGEPDFYDGAYNIMHILDALFYDYDDDGVGDLGLDPADYYNPEGKNVILVSNFIDESYYDPSYPYYIAGFYSPSLEYVIDRNIISIDAMDWLNRVGPDGSRPNLYESTIAHEYQHLIHDDYYVDDMSYMNEACSLFAEPLCGYDLDTSQIDWFLATPDNSLTEWLDQGDINGLADYGASFLWGLYLTDHYGFNFLQRYVQANILIDPDFTLDPEDRITALLKLAGKKVDFYDVFHNWRLANLIHSDHPGHGLYNYQLDELRAFTGNPDQILDFDELEPLHINTVDDKFVWFESAEENFGETITLEDPPDAVDGWNTGMYKVGPFGTDYIEFTKLSGFDMLLFKGDEVGIWGWTNDAGYWHSGGDNLLNALLISDPYPVQAGDILTIDTYWDIEDYWDYGFVQISADNGATWTSLPDVDGITTMDHDPQAKQEIVDNLPGITSWSAFYDIFDGSQDGFMTLSFDLSAYEGQTVLIGFRYMTDWYTYYDGWFIFDVWTGDFDTGFHFENFYPQYPDARYMVTIVEKYAKKGHVKYKIGKTFICDKDDIGYAFAHISKYENPILVVSPIMDKGFCDYEFTALKLFGRWF